ncbi:HesA/MoeB/ThiF family protein [Psychrosphaera sp. 1_MG-2023]|uniref:HesA/MoeB/ThiF family protein n=1 Tax=Psychrosphaera sp. 1_MG-2023 TaxID=3062643 RepID=UPI0026E16827|nr:HesA/MoeB/ThiF family protein [Psychrosphaera sp. 1_MG-2023]MDO6719284.1 HesA/MoeB/ThiF family protein [Psychrosphaera sp. 1_MG-2023]
MANLTDKQFLRYHRHVMVEKIGEQGQLAFQNSRVLIIGLGGLGCPAAQYLTAAGVGTLTLVDHDTIESSNLQRQILYGENNIGEKKAIVAQQKLSLQNSLIVINAIAESIFNFDLAALIERHDVVLDCTDNVKTRRLINATCKQHQTQLVSASAIQASGQLISFDFSIADSPCYECLFPESVDAPQNCSTAGVFSPILGVLGSLQATETLRLILGEYNNLNQLMLFDAWGMATQKFKLNRRSDCPVCRHK